MSRARDADEPPGVDRAAARRGDTDEVVRLDFQIHEFFVDLSGNSFLKIVKEYYF